MLQVNDRLVDGWHDKRGHLTWRTRFSADATPSDTLVAEVEYVVS